MWLVRFADRNDVVFRYAKEAGGKVTCGVGIFPVNDRCRGGDANGVVRIFSTEGSKSPNETGGFGALRSGKRMGFIENKVIQTSIPE